MFRLLKDAQIASSLSPTELKLAENARQVLGKTSLADIVESMSPSNEDYIQWLRAATEEAGERGRHWSKREFIDYFMGDGEYAGNGVFENDPLAPSPEMQELVVNKLWNDYKAAKVGTRIQKVARHQENEEALRAADEYANSIADTDDVAITADDVPLGADVEGSFGDDAFGVLDTDDVAASDDCCGDEGIDVSKADGESTSLSSDDVDAIAAAIIDQLRNDTAGQDTSSFAMSSPAPAKEEEEHGKPKQHTNLQQMLSGPRSTISQAQKEIEADGENAWKAHQLPSNPHPKKSIAYSAWERGMRKAVKSHFGFDDKPSTPTKRKK